ncbi:MAG: YfhO family protein [Verrucomicrobiae bacterium]|nr:YfhO family protein [Verrucomicrobiae bacterium]
MILVLFVWVDLTTHQPNLAPTISRSVYAEKNIAETSLADARMGVGRALPSDAAQNYFLSGPSKPLTEHFREKRAGLYSDMNLLDEVAKVNGFYSLWLPRFGEVQHLLYDGPHELRQGFADFLGIRHVTSSRSPIEWMTRNTARPLVTAGQAPVVMSFAEIQAALPTPQFNPAENVLLETPISGPVRDRSATVTNLQWVAHRIRFRVNAAVPTMATIAQSHYHCWRATLNGAPVPIHLANGAFQALAVPAGDSEIVMEYVDRGFQIGAMLSGLSVLMAMGFWLRLRA